MLRLPSRARTALQQFLSAVKYCHSHFVAHRDLKLDNTLLDASNPPIIKICDFGFAKTWSEEANMFTQIGTPVYMSPELINTKNAKGCAECSRQSARVLGSAAQGQQQ